MAKIPPCQSLRLLHRYYGRLRVDHTTSTYSIIEANRMEYAMHNRCLLVPPSARLSELAPTGRNYQEFRITSTMQAGMFCYDLEQRIEPQMTVFQVLTTVLLLTVGSVFLQWRSLKALVVLTANSRPC